MDQGRVRNIIRLFALQNAVFHGGTANSGAVLGMVLASQPGLRKHAQLVREEVESVVSEVNTLQLEEQKVLLKNTAPEMLEKEEKKQEALQPLPNAVEGKVVTRFAPAPTGPLHISHILRAAMLSFLYARKYGGKFILRLEDTDAKKIEKSFYSMIKADLKAVGISWDMECLESDFMEKYYHIAGKLIGKGKLYVCTCPAEEFRKLKEKKKACHCRKNTPAYNKELWDSMVKGEIEEGGAAVRLKTSMGHKNPALRDPPMFRVNKASHPVTKKKYSAWPLYNFATGVADHLNGVTHVFRAKEHEHNTSIQKVLFKDFDWEFPEVLNFGLIHLPGESVHKRDIVKGMKEGKYSGWDDIKLPTIQALVRRGIMPETFKECALVAGLSKTDINFSWENLEGVNRKVIDPLASRCMVVLDPVRLDLDTAADVKFVQASVHPDFRERGTRMLPISGSVYLSREDYTMALRKEIRLKGLFNVKVDGKVARYSGNFVSRDMPKIQWVSEPNVKVEILTKDSILEGLGERPMLELKVGEIVQMERMGFGRVDSKGKGKVTIAFGHK